MSNSQRAMQLSKANAGLEKAVKIGLVCKAWLAAESQEEVDRILFLRPKAASCQDWLLSPKRGLLNGARSATL